MRYLALALEFQLGADILSTAITPSWDQIGKLGAIATIRTGLNYFLMREMNEGRVGTHTAGQARLPVDSTKHDETEPVFVRQTDGPTRSRSL